MCCHDGLAPERTLSDFVGYSDNLEHCEDLCNEYKYFGRQGLGECWCGDEIRFDHGSLSPDCDCNGTDVGDLIECIYSAVQLVTVDTAPTFNTDKPDEGIAEISIEVVEYPPKIDGVVYLSFCMHTTMKKDGYAMMDSRSPFFSEFHYDGNFDVTVEVVPWTPFDVISDTTVFTADAFVCDPSSWTVNTDLLEIGGVLYICISPKSDQLTTMIEEVNFLKLDQNDGENTFDAVADTVPSPVTIVTGKGSRNIIIGTRVPASFFRTDFEINGVGEVVLKQRNRLLGSTKMDESRSLQEDVENNGPGAFLLNFKVVKLEEPTGSARSNASSNLKISIILLIFGVLHCLN